MDIEKIVKQKFPNWEVTPKRKKASVSADTLKSAEQTSISFSEMKEKYGATHAADSDSEYQIKPGIDRKWESFFTSPKDTSSDAPADQKIHFFDEDGDEVASQG